MPICIKILLLIPGKKQHIKVSQSASLSYLSDTYELVVMAVV